MAAVLSFFIPGLGQLVQGRVLTSLVCFFGTLVGYVLFIVPGLVMHLITIVDAASYETRRQQQNLLKALKQ